MLGISGGTSYYMGDLNPMIPFNMPSPSFGGLLKYNINPRYAFKGSLMYGSLKGDDLNFASDFHQRRAARFSTSYLETSLQFEFNFMEYEFDIRKRSFSPYVVAGIGYTLTLGGAGNFVNLPFGVGVKRTLSNRASAGIEWNFRKLFSDNLDGIVNVGNDTYGSIFVNNDWYSYAGIFITYRIFDKSGDCPVYW